MTAYTTFLDDTLARGHNAIELEIFNHDPNTNNPPRNGNGDLPFLKRLDGANWTGALTYGNIASEAPDFTTPNEAYWSFIDTLLATCESRGVLVLAFPSYVGYQGGPEGWMKEMVANGATRMNQFGAFVAARYKNRKNIVWMMGGDMGTSQSFSSTQIAVENALINGLKSVAGQQSTVFSGLWDSESICTDQGTFGGQCNLQGAYSWTGQVNVQDRKGYAHSPVMPSFLLESPYDEEGPDGNNFNPNATQPVRRFIWWGWLSSIGGYVSGNGYIWRFLPGWQSHLDTPGSQDMTRLNGFVRSIAWQNLVPSGLAGMKTLITAGGGSVSGSDYVAAAAAPDGKTLVAYVPPTGSGTRSFTVDMTAMSAASRARWYNPTTAAYTDIASGLPNTGTRSFTTPGNNGAGVNDWILLLTVTGGSAPPTVATPASASPSPATGTITNLGVLGADDGGEPSLIYTWAATGTPPAPVAFSVNGSNAAKNTTATFTKAGSYTLQATIRDADAQTVTSAVTVTVNQTLTSIGVSPTSATVAPNAMQQFTATAKDQFGLAMGTQPSFGWSVSGGGTISASGLFTAGGAAGGPFPVTAQASGKSGTASVTVSSATAASYRINCGGGAVGAFAADQFFSGGSTFTTTSAVVTSGVANAAPAAVYQSERYGNHSYTFGGLTPGAPYTVRLHFAEIYFTTAGARAFNVAINGVAALTNFDIVASAGAFKAVVRDFSATASAGGQIAIQYTTVKDNAKSSGIEIMGSVAPGPPTVAVPGAANPNPVAGTSTNLSVLGADDAGEPNLIYTWSTTGTPPAPVTFGANGTNAAKNTTATFTKAGSYGLLVTIRDQSNATVTSTVGVTVNQTLTSIVVSPSSASVAVGGTQPFVATANDQFGNNLAPQPSFSWTVSGGGSINASGVFTAGGAAGGPFTVTASSGGKSGAASVTVTGTGSVALFRVSAGGGATGSYSADQLFSGGTAFVGTSAIDTSGVPDPAPAAVYQSERWGNFTYTFSGLAPGASHTVRLHFAEIYWTAAGQRTFHVMINGAQVLTSFDIIAAAGGAKRAVVRQFTANADASGRIAIRFTPVIDQAKASGIEILKP